FKFLNSYEREDSSIFFGRDEEINALYEMVFQSSVILIYGASGTGKTSLINCGLAGKFQQHDWLPLMIRRGNNINDSLEKALIDAGGNPASLKDDIKWLDEWSDETETKTSALSPVGRSIKAVYQKSFRPVYLIFDQFEELFILGSLQEQELFIKTVQDILQSEQPVKLIFSIREEYLGYLFDFEQAVPQLLRKKIRIEPMNLEKVKQVIFGVVNYENSNISLKPNESEQIAKGIFEKIRGKGKSLTIQLPFLQIFLDKFYLKITGDESRKAEAVFSVKALNDMGEIGDILINFLEEQVTGISKNLGVQYPGLTAEMVWKILSPFSTLEGTKEPICRQNLYDRLPGQDKAMINAAVEAFIYSRILRYNEVTDMFEIAHDSLAKPIAEKRSVEEKALLEISRMIKSQVDVKEEAREYFSEKQLMFIDPYLDKLKPDSEEKDWISKSRVYIKKQKELVASKQLAELNKTKRQRFLTIAIVVLLVFVSLFIYLAINARKQAANAREQEKIAQDEKDKSEIAQGKTKELLKLVMQGRGEQYNNQSDSAIIERLQHEQNYPIDSLITPRASVSRLNDGSNNRNYLLWIDVPSFRKNEIKEVKYILCRGFADRLRISNEPSSSFSIGYLGWGFCPTVNIEIILANSDTIKRNFSFDDYFKTHQLSD
ncbi:MAG: ATP-binding protein, partial [Bacteroidota bacterium]